MDFCQDNSNKLVPFQKGDYAIPSAAKYLVQITRGSNPTGILSEGWAPVSSRFAQSETKLISNPIKEFLLN